MTEVIAPPADRPVTKTRLASIPWSDFILSTICLIDNASPWPRLLWLITNQLKQLRGLLPWVCSGRACGRGCSGG